MPKMKQPIDIAQRDAEELRDLTGTVGRKLLHGFFPSEEEVFKAVAAWRKSKIVLKGFNDSALSQFWKLPYVQRNVEALMRQQNERVAQGIGSAVEQSRLGTTQTLHRPEQRKGPIPHLMAVLKELDLHERIAYYEVDKHQSQPVRLDAATLRVYAQLYLAFQDFPETRHMLQSRYAGLPWTNYIIRNTDRADPGETALWRETVQRHSHLFESATTHSPSKTAAIVTLPETRDTVEKKPAPVAPILPKPAPSAPVETPAPAATNEEASAEQTTESAQKAVEHLTPPPTETTQQRLVEDELVAILETIEQELAALNAPREVTDRILAYIQTYGAALHRLTEDHGRIAMRAFLMNATAPAAVVTRAAPPAEHVSPPIEQPATSADAGLPTEEPSPPVTSVAMQQTPEAPVPTEPASAVITPTKQDRPEENIVDVGEYAFLLAADDPLRTAWLHKLSATVVRELSASGYRSFSQETRDTVVELCDMLLPVHASTAFLKHFRVSPQLVKNWKNAKTGMRQKEPAHDVTTDDIPVTESAAPEIIETETAPESTPAEEEPVDIGGYVFLAGLQAEVQRACMELLPTLRVEPLQKGRRRSFDDIQVGTIIRVYDVLKDAAHGAAGKFAAHFDISPLLINKWKKSASSATEAVVTNAKSARESDEADVRRPRQQDRPVTPPASAKKTVVPSTETSVSPPTVDVRTRDKHIAIVQHALTLRSDPTARDAYYTQEGVTPAQVLTWLRTYNIPMDGSATSPSAEGAATQASPRQAASSPAPGAEIDFQTVFPYLIDPMAEPEPLPEGLDIPVQQQGHELRAMLWLRKRIQPLSNEQRASFTRLRALTVEEMTHQHFAEWLAIICQRYSLDPNTQASQTFADLLFEALHDFSMIVPCRKAAAEAFGLALSAAPARSKKPR